MTYICDTWQVLHSAESQIDWYDRIDATSSSLKFRLGQLFYQKSN
jgi:hypothetical protein